MMFSIDLLKGKGLPRKTDLKRLLTRAVPFLIPVLAVMAYASEYNRGINEMTQLQAKLDQSRQQVEKFKDNVAAFNQLDREIRGMKKCLNDISKALSYRIQVSDVMVEFVNLMPADVFVYEMKLDHNAVQDRYTDEVSGESKQRLLVKRKIKLILCAYGESGDDDAVQGYVKKLRQSPILDNIITDVKPSARELGEVEDRPAVYYEIECTLKQQG